MQKWLFFLFFTSFNFLYGQSDKIVHLSELNLLVYNDPQQAIKKGLVYFENSENPTEQVALLLVVANAYVVLKDHDQSFEYAFQAEQIAEKSNISSDKVKALGFIGAEYYRIGLNDKALDYLNRADQLIQRNPLPDSLSFIEGNILFFKGQLEKKKFGNLHALNNFERALKIFEKQEDKKSILTSISILYNNIGEIYFEENNFEKSKSNFENAKHYAQKVNSIKNEANANLGLGKIDFKLNEFAKAEKKLLLALDLSKQANDIATLTEIYKNLALVAQSNSDKENYEKYSQLHLNYEKKMVEKEEKSLDQLTQKKTNENDLNKKNWGRILLISSILLLLILVISFYKLRKRHLKILKDKQNLGE